MATNTKNINRAAIIWLILVFPIGLLIMWLRTDWSKTVKWTITAFFALLAIVAIANSSSNSNNQQQTTTQSSVSSTPSDPSNSPEPTEAPTVTPKPTLTTQQIIANFENQAQTVTVANIYKSPNSYKGKGLIFTCSVSGFPKDDNGDVAALNCTDPNDFSSNVQIGIDKKTDVTQINQNDTIKVYGMGLGADAGKNAFGV